MYRAYGRELAKRGYVVLAPDYPSFGDYPYDFSADAYASGTMKGIFNHMRCVDYLQSLPEVDGERIVEATFLASGCGPAIAASSMATVMLKGKTIEEALRISHTVVSEALGGLPPTKMHCAHLAEKAIRTAISNYQRCRKGLETAPEKNGGIPKQKAF